MEQPTPVSKALVFISLAYAPIIGGAERQAQALLERWAQQGREVWMLTRRVSGLPAEEVIGGVRVFRLRTVWLPLISWLTFSLSVLLFLIPRRERIHSIWSIMLNVTTLAASLAGRWLNRPVVLKISASGTGGNLQLMKRSFFGSTLASFLLRSCRAIIVLNDEVIAELTPYSVPAEKMHRISNGVDTDFFHPPTPEERHARRVRLGLRNETVAVLFVGRFEAQKNLINLLTIWPTIYQKCPQARLLLVGGGPDEPMLKKLARDGKAIESIQFLGRQPDVRGLYHAADLFILPSWFEGISNALLEAMACGVPAVVSQVPGNVDVIRGPEEGQWIDPAKPSAWVDVVSVWIQSEGLRKEFGPKVRQVVQERFSIESIFAQYQNLARSLDVD